jgi:hypothetical protein
MHHYTIILRNTRKRAEHSVIAASTVNALRIGIPMMQAFGLPCAITCKPAKGARQ